MRSRHTILYDVERWRRNRTLLLFPATVFVLVTVFSTTLHAGSSVGAFSLVGAFLYALALSFYTRQRLSYLAVEGEALVIRVMFNRVAVPLEDVRQAKVGRLGSRLAKPEQRRRLPRPASRWLDVDAAIIRIDTDAQLLVKVSRLLGARCLEGRDLVVPVADPAVLVEEITARMPRAQPPLVGSRRGKRRR